MLSSYVLLAITHEEFIPIINRLLEEAHSDLYVNLHKMKYNSYFGRQWFIPIHLGIINSCTDDDFWKSQTATQLIKWQENWSYMSMIGPHFGLSQDYDEFILWGAGPLLGLLSSLFSENTTLRLYFGEILHKIIKKTHNKYKIPNLIWMYHILPVAEESSSLYSFCREELQQLNCYSINLIENPPFFNFDEDTLDAITSDAVVPTFTNYIKAAKAKNKLTNNRRVQLACIVLSNDEFDDNFGSQIVAAI